MIVYVMLNILLILFGVILTKYAMCSRNEKGKNRKFFVIVCVIILSFVSAARGDFSTDYNGYEQIYLRFSSYSLGDILQRGYFANPETGYLVFQHLIRMLFGNVIYIFIISSVIVVYSNIYVLKKNPEILLVVFLFVNGGIYFDSFNLVRQALAVSIVLCGSRYLYERKLTKYLMVILFASTIHISALIMVPFYFLSKISLKKKHLGILFGVLVCVIMLQPYITSYVVRYMWNWYDWEKVGGFSWKNIVSPVAMSVLGAVLYLVNTKKEMKEKLKIENVQLIAMFFYLGFNVMGLYNRYIGRMSMYFSTYTISFLGFQVSNSRHKKILRVIVILTWFLYSIAVNDSVPYYFILER